MSVERAAMDEDQERRVDWWYVAICARCQPILPMPFRDRGERDEWAGGHNGETGHPILLVRQAERTLSQRGNG